MSSIKYGRYFGHNGEFFNKVVSSGSTLFTIVLVFFTSYCTPNAITKLESMSPVGSTVATYLVTKPVPERRNASTVSGGFRFVPSPVSAHNRSERTPGVGDGYGEQNSTGFYIDNDEADTSMYVGFTDMQTLFIACFATLIPLILSLLIAFAIRVIWKKYSRERECQSYDGILNRNESSAPLSSRSGGLTLSADELKTTESQFSLGDGVGADGLLSAGVGDDCDANVSPVLTYSNASSRNHTSANGSIITMTLKNNHLIVETEERNDLADNSRETTMKYSPSNHDGVFVVEVQQGRRLQNYMNPACNSPDDEMSRSSDQRALVHRPPAEALTDSEDSAFRDSRGRTLTGLSQSDLSETSNYSYRYGNQQGYDSGHYGYPIYSGYTTEPSKQRPPSPDPDKPIITSAIYKETPTIGGKPQHRVLHSMNSIDTSVPGFEPLMSDVQAKERILHINEEPAEVVNDDPFLEEQKALGNGQLKEENAGQVKQNGVDNVKNEDVVKINDVSAGKDLYNQIKETTKELLPVAAPKFEKLENDISPSPDMQSDVIEGNENKAFVPITSTQS